MSLLLSCALFSLFSRGLRGAEIQLAVMSVLYGQAHDNTFKFSNSNTPVLDSAALNCTERPVFFGFWHAWRGVFLVYDLRTKNANTIWF